MIFKYVRTYKSSFPYDGAIFDVDKFQLNNDNLWEFIEKSHLIASKDSPLIFYAIINNIYTNIDIPSNITDEKDIIQYLKLQFNF